MKRRSEKWERLFALFVLGCSLFNYPVLHIFSTDGFIAGIPVLYVYLFTVWLVLIFLSAWIAERRG